MEEVLKELAYFKGITYYTSEFCSPENPLPDCVTDNLIQYAELVGSTSNKSSEVEILNVIRFFRKKIGTIKIFCIPYSIKVQIKLFLYVMEAKYE